MLVPTVAAIIVAFVTGLLCLRLPPPWDESGMLVCGGILTWSIVITIMISVGNDSTKLATYSAIFTGLPGTVGVLIFLVMQGDSLAERSVSFAVSAVCATTVVLIVAPGVRAISLVPKNTDP